MARSAYINFLYNHRKKILCFIFPVTIGILIYGFGAIGSLG